MELLLGVIETVISVIVGVLYPGIIALAFLAMTALVILLIKVVILLIKGLMEKPEEE